MKKMLEKLGYGFVIGAGIGIGAFCVFLVIDYFKDNNQFERADIVTISNPIEIEIVDSRLVTFGEKLIIAVVIENKADISWEEVQIEAQLFDADGFFGECGNYFSIEFKSNEKKNVEIQCSKILTAKMPPKTKYKVKVASASRKK